MEPEDGQSASRTGDDEQPPTQQLARVGLVLLRALPVLLGALVALLAVWRLQEVLTPIFLAFVIAYVLDPLVDRLEARKIPRGIGILLVMLALVLALAAFLLFVIPSLVEDIVRVAKDVPRRVAALVVSIEPWLRTRGVTVPHSVEEAINRFGGQLQEAAPGALGGATQVLQTAGRGTLSFISGVGNLVVVAVITFYLLLDFDAIVNAMGGLVPHRYKRTVGAVAKEVDATLAQWIRGQLTVMLILAVLYSVGFSLAGIRLAVGIGILAGVLSFIPYFGTGVGLVLAVLMALIDWHGPLPLILVIAVVAAVQVLDGILITPRIVGGKVGLGPAWIIIALMTGGQLFGFLGVLVAVPSAAIIKILVARSVAYYRKTHLYRAGATPEALLAEAAATAPTIETPATAAAVVALDTSGAPEDDTAKPYSALTAQLEAAAKAADAAPAIEAAPATATPNVTGGPAGASGDREAALDPERDAQVRCRDGSDLPEGVQADSQTREPALPDPEE